MKVFVFTVFLILMNCVTKKDIRGSGQQLASDKKNEEIPVGLPTPRETEEKMFLSWRL